MWYLLGMGSNIHPRENMALALAALARAFDMVWVGRIGVTEPIGLDTDQDFLNAVSMIWAPLSPAELKVRLNRIETDLGRDRSDPERAGKDRTIDLDILDQGPTPFAFKRELDERYYRQILRATENPGAVPEFRSAEIELGGVRLGQTPATIHWHRGTGHKIVIDQGQ